MRGCRPETFQQGDAVKIGIVKEIKPQENRVGMVPSGVRALVEAGGDVFVEKNCGDGSGISDKAFQNAGASVVSNAKAVWEKADLIIKVKEPLESEFELMQEGQALYTYLLLFFHCLIPARCYLG